MINEMTGTLKVPVTFRWLFELEVCRMLGAITQLDDESAAGAAREQRKLNPRIREMPEVPATCAKRSRRGPNGH